jgi:hypothetical protein
MSKTFTELGALTSLAGVDVLAVVDMTDSTTKKITATNIAAFLADLEQTLASKTLTSPVLNGTLSGTAFLDEDDMASDSAIAAASQQSIKAYIASFVASGAATFSNKNFSQDGQVSITDTGSTTSESPLTILVPNLDDIGIVLTYMGFAESNYNSFQFTFYKESDGSQNNEIQFGLYGVGSALRVNGYQNVGIGAAPGGDGGARVSIGGAVGITDTLTLSKASGTGLSVTSDIDFNAIASGATKAEINAAAAGIGVSIPKAAIFNIGDWNMNTTNTVVVDPSLSGSKIYAVKAMIRGDAPTGIYYPLDGTGLTGGTVTPQGGVQSWSASGITLNRLTGGMFDDTNFETTSYNRGYVIVWYID